MLVFHSSYCIYCFASISLVFVRKVKCLVIDLLMQQKRKKQQQQEASGKAAKKYKEFKFWMLQRLDATLLAVILRHADAACSCLCTCWKVIVTDKCTRRRWGPILSHSTVKCSEDDSVLSVIQHADRRSCIYKMWAMALQWLLWDSTKRLLVDMVVTCTSCKLLKHFFIFLSVNISVGE